MLLSMSLTCFTMPSLTRVSPSSTRDSRPTSCCRSAFNRRATRASLAPMESSPSGASKPSPSMEPCSSVSPSCTRSDSSRSSSTSRPAMPKNSCKAPCSCCRAAVHHSLSTRAMTREASALRSVSLVLRSSDLRPAITSWSFISSRTSACSFLLSCWEDASCSLASCSWAMVMLCRSLSVLSLSLVASSSCCTACSCSWVACSAA
mmetsp:Transcript_808/g.1838  ORF Transcript_808/g.1838 Transcript_808/m.1838 type:complete len:205 (-) Transcript_808:85-699(-)